MLIIPLHKKPTFATFPWITALLVLVNIFIYFGVLRIYQNSHYATLWMVSRCVNKAIRHFYNAYLHMDLRFEIYSIDWFRMTSFYLTYTFEFLVGSLIVLTTIPELKKEPKVFRISALNFNIDYLFVLVFYFCVSVPYFLNTLVYLHRKRKQMLKHAAKLHDD